MISVMTNGDCGDGICEDLFIQYVFDSYLDHVIDRLEEKGVDAVVGMEVIFNIVEHLGSNGVLPEFPDVGASCVVLGKWLLAAVDFGFADFVVEAVE